VAAISIYDHVVGARFSKPMDCDTFDEQPQRVHDLADYTKKGCMGWQVLEIYARPQRAHPLWAFCGEE
jgi:hypothetical protein